MTVHIRIWKPDGTFDTKSTVADIQRSGIAGYGNGKHGFSYDIDWSAYPNGTYNVVAYALDGVSPTPPQIEGQISYVKGTSGAYVWPTVSKTMSRGYLPSIDHWGIDILPVVANQTGDNIYAFTNGNVTRNQYSDSFGEVIYINHIDPKPSDCYLQTRYAHLLSRAIGDNTSSVTRNQIIGYMGHSGEVYSSTGGNGTHLHFETIKVNSLTDIGPIIRNTSNSYDPLQRYFTNTGGILAASSTFEEPSTFTVDENGNVLVDEDYLLYVDYTIDPDPEDFGCCGNMD